MAKVKRKDVKKSIDTGSLSGGGKAPAASYPYPSAFADEEDVQTKPEEWTKLRKLDGTFDAYDPSKLEDEVLRDDFRIILAWYSTWKENPESSPGGLGKADIEELLRRILEEMKKRGPECIIFHPGKMRPHARELFERVAAKVGIPDKQLDKEFEVSKEAPALSPWLDVESLTSSDLRSLHDDLHRAYRRAATEKPHANLSTEDVANLHAMAVGELDARKLAHPAPPDDGLDDVSTTLEGRGHSPIAKAYQRVQHSGVKVGERITLQAVLDCFQTFKMSKPFVYLVGGLANHGETEGDIDILVKAPEGMPDQFKHVLAFRLGRALPSGLAERMQIHYDTYHGPFTNFVELYDLVLERVPGDAVKEMSDESGSDEPEVQDEREKAYADAAAKSLEEDGDDDLDDEEAG